MGNFRRTVWATVIFIGLLAPFAIVLAMSLELRGPARAAMAGGVGQQEKSGSGTQDAPSLQTMLITPPPSPLVTAASANDSPLLASGDGKTLWVVHPVVIGEKDKQVRAYELLARSSNSGTWAEAQSDRGPYFSGFPRGLAAVSERDSKSLPAAYVFTEGSITRFSLKDHQLIHRSLGNDQQLLAETGGVGEMFAVTVGPREEPTTQAANPIDEIPVPGAIDVPETQRAASQPASAPATAASQPVKLRCVNVWSYRNEEWTALPAMAAGEVGTGDAPGTRSSVTVLATGGRLIVLWAEGGADGVLKARALDYKRNGAAWGPLVTTPVKGAFPEDLRLLSVVVDDSAYVFWPVISGRMLSLHGGPLPTRAGAEDDLVLPVRRLLPPLNLGNVAAGQGPKNVAMGAAENSLAVLVQDDKNALSFGTFTAQGAPLIKLALIDVKATPRDLQIVQNIALLLLLLMLVLSLWQWRQRPSPLKLPAGMVTASLPLRGFAFGIDMGLALILVSVFFGVSDYGAMVVAWADAVTNPEGLVNTPSLLYTLAVYLAHVTVGELFFRKSLGKMLLGLQVLMVDGKAPTVAAILLRNLVRIPELLSGVLVIYLMVSETRQRLGDALARTLVVTTSSPETPEDPDEGGKDAEEEKEALVGSGKAERLRWVVRS